MANSSIKKATPEILVEKVTVITGGSSTTFYASFSKSIAKTGYIPIAVTGPQFNQAAIYAYHLAISGSSVVVGAAKASQSGSISSLSIYVDVTYMKV